MLSSLAANGKLRLVHDPGRPSRIDFVGMPCPAWPQFGYENWGGGQTVRPDWGSSTGASRPGQLTPMCTTLGRTMWAGLWAGAGFAASAPSRVVHSQL